jgi:hypothetical protein
MDHKNSWLAHDWINSGSKLLATDPKQAQTIIGQGIKHNPFEPIGWFNLAIGLHQQRKINSAIAAYKHCLSLNCDPKTRLAAENNLAQDLMLLNKNIEGWKFYRNRFKRKPGNYNLFKQAFGEPAANIPSANNPLLLMSEQGLGDTIQFSRFALLLQNQNYDVTLLCQPPLIGLLSKYGGLTNVVDSIITNEHTSKKPAWLPLMDLGNRLSRLDQSIPYANGYLSCSDSDTYTWNTRLGRKPGKKLIALHWQGNPGHEGSLYSRGRSMTFQHWLELKNTQNYEFVSIQKGEGKEQLKIDAGLNFVRGQEIVDKSMDFCDTAAILKNCDLLLSADSGVVHLAGALGVPTWLALRWIPEWRWGLNNTFTPWYTSLRLFRQVTDGDWHGVVAKISNHLESHLA